jgi:hypothetical protein
MAHLLDEKITYCTKCKKFISYDKNDIKTGEHEYYVYGCELNYESYKYIKCPKCQKEIELDRYKIKLVN